MRKIGQIKNKSHRKKLQGYLYYHGIESHQYEDEEDLWVLKDDDREKAKEYLKIFNEVYIRGFSESASSLKIDSESKLGFEKLKKEKREQEEKEKKSKMVNFRRNSFGKRGFSLPPGTAFLILTSVLVFFITRTGARESVYRLLLISQVQNAHLFGLPLFYEVTGGQVWRLVTPIFLHHDFFHILFNMMWVYQIGVLIEKKEGASFYLLLTCFVGVISNSAYYLVAGPIFGGMSGVVYGFIGYIWGYRKMAPMSSYFIDQGLFRFFVFWYVLCWGLTAFGFGIANTVHGIGALSGCFLGVFRAHKKEENSLSFKRLFSKDNLYSFSILFVLAFGSFFVDSLYY